MKKTTIRKRMIFLLGSLMFAAFFVVLLFSRIAFQVYITNQLADDFNEEVSIVTSVFKEEFIQGLSEESTQSFIAKVRSGQKRLGYFNLDSQLEIVSVMNGNIRVFSSDLKLSSDEEALIKNAVSNNEFNTVLNLVKTVENEKKEYRLYISPIKINNTQPARFFAVMYVSIEEEINVLKQFTRMLFIILFIVFVLAMTALFFIASSLTKPIKEMKAYAISIGKKQTPKEITFHTQDELADLANALNTMAKEIIEANEEQLRFLQNASHELKTPLTSIQGYAEGIMDHVIEDQNEALSIIIDESIRLKKIVNQLTLLSKLETGVMNYKVEIINIVALIEDVMNRIRLNEVDSIDIVIQANPHELYEVVGDYDVYIQCFMNILSNALRYASKEVLVQIIKNSNKIEILFIDDGLGIRESAIPHVFERFYKGNKGDTGLGLAIVKAMTKQLNGSVEVYNSEDKGAVFKFVFPNH